MAQVLKEESREMILDAAKDEFMENGFKESSMRRIAQKSKMTVGNLYRYFKNKEDIYSAVIDGELMRISEPFLAVARKSLPPVDKIVELLFAHLSLIKEAVERNGNLRAEFFRNIWQVERVRKKYDRVELDIFAKCISDGVALGQFEVDDIAFTADIIHGCVKGLEVPYIYGRLGEGMTINISRPIVKKLIHKALGV